MPQRSPRSPARSITHTLRDTAFPQCLKCTPSCSTTKDDPAQAGTGAALGPCVLQPDSTCCQIVSHVNGKLTCPCQTVCSACLCGLLVSPLWLAGYTATKLEVKNSPAVAATGVLFCVHLKHHTICHRHLAAAGAAAAWTTIVAGRSNSTCLQGAATSAAALQHVHGVQEAC